MNYKPQFLIHQSPKDGEPVEPFSNSLLLSAFVSVNLGSFYLSNQFNLRNL
jgi:hypothetical protein